MSSSVDHSTTDGTFIELSASRIRERTGWRVRMIEVSCAGGSVVVRGQADSNYACQRAIAACQQVLAGVDEMRLDLNLEVDWSMRATANVECG
jgi:hypothetical protein